MVTAPDALDLTALEIARLVQQGEVGAREIAEASFARIRERDPRLNAFRETCETRALAAASAIDSLDAEARAALPLAGVPVGIKDEIDVAGMVTRSGGNGNSEPATADAEVVRRLREAGAIVVGKTNQPEFGQVPFTEGAWGETTNPWNPDYSAAGSSGGSAVAVATGLVPVAIGSDGGGSIRLPAACGGIFGIKPSRGRVSSSPKEHLWYGLGTYGPFARTVADAALVLEVISGPTERDRWELADPERPFADTVTADPEPLRIGWSIRPPLPGLGATREVCLEVARKAALLQSLGHEVVRFDPHFPKRPWAFIFLNWHGIAGDVDATQHPARLERRSRETARAARISGDRALRRSLRDGEVIEDALAASLADVDVLLMPVLPDVAPNRITTSHMGVLASQSVSTRTVGYTAMFNVSGQPAASVPVGFNREGLPHAVQVIGKHGDEATVLAVAAQLERVRPWADSLPVWPPRPAGRPSRG